MGPRRSKTAPRARRQPAAGATSPSIALPCPPGLRGTRLPLRLRCLEMESKAGLPPKQGLYDPRHEHDACGVGFVAHIKGRKSHSLVQNGIRILLNLAHRGAVAADPLAGDGAGLLTQLPDKLFRAEAK